MTSSTVHRLADGASQALVADFIEPAARPAFLLLVTVSSPPCAKLPEYINNISLLPSDLTSSQILVA